MIRRIFIIMLGFFCINSLCGMQVASVSTEATKALARGLHLLGVGKKEEALECFFKVLESGSNEERENAQTYIRNLLATNMVKTADAQAQSQKPATWEEDAAALLLEDNKALKTVEAKYYFVDGRWCVTAGLIPNKQLEYAGILEEQKRIAMGQHQQAAQFKGPKDLNVRTWTYAVTSGFIPDAWGVSPTPQIKQFWGRFNEMSVQKKNESKALAELRLRQANQVVEEKSRIAQQTNDFYLKALAGNTDQQGLDRLKTESMLASAALQDARVEVERLTLELFKIK